MLKKMIAVLMLIAFGNVYAFTPIAQAKALESELSKTFDALNYKLNVEWDQKDAKFFDGAIADFEKDLATLQSAGLTKEDLVNYTMGKIKDQEVKNEINELSKVVAQSKMSDAEARAFVVSKLNSTYSHGASWSGSRMGRHTAFIIGIIIILIIVAHHDDDDSTTDNRCQEYPTYPYPTTLSQTCGYDFVGSSECCPQVVVY